MDITGHDLRHLAEELAERLADEHADSGPETIMTSIGYVDLWLDGTITVNGTNYEGVDPDSVHSHCPVCSWGNEARFHDECLSTTVELVRVTS